jgi:sugar lactone lactonase YvrE
VAILVLFGSRSKPPKQEETITAHIDRPVPRSAPNVFQPNLPGVRKPEPKPEVGALRTTPPREIEPVTQVTEVLDTTPAQRRPMIICREDDLPMGPPKPVETARAEEVKSDQPKTDPVVQAPGKLIVKHRKSYTEEELIRQVGKAEEVALDRDRRRLESVSMVAVAQTAHAQGKKFDGAPLVLKQRTDLAGLSFRMGDACTISPDAAGHLQGGSLALRAALFDAAQTTATRGGTALSGDTRPDPARFSACLATGERNQQWQRPEAVPALQQLLMAENQHIRLVLVDQLAHIDGPRASVALAQRALFDLNPEVRQAALEALRGRPKDEYCQVLLDGLLYPWPVVADHAAEALVVLDLRDTVPNLIGLLDAPDPAAPYEKPGVGLVVREVVRINHLRNCLMCHAPSFSTDDKVRGFVPPSTQPLPPAFTREYYAPKQEGIFVRADVTYLQQDFSVQLPVENAEPWPAVQRFDFMVRERPARTLDMPVKAAPGETLPPSEQRKALFFALRELTGTDPGPTVEDWKRLLLRTSAPVQVRGGLKGSGGLAADANGFFVADTAQATLFSVRDSESKLLKNDRAIDGLALDARGRLIVCQSGKVAALDPVSGEETILADSTRTPSFVAADRQGGLYLSVREGTDARTPGAVYYLSAQGTLTHLPILLKKPRGLAVSPDGKTLYVSSGETGEAWAFTLESVGNPVKGRVLCKLAADRGETQLGGGVAVDARGNVYLANPGRRSVQVVSSEGARLGVVSLPEAPLYVAVGGPDGKRLFVASTESVYAVELTVGPGVAARHR